MAPDVSRAQSEPAVSNGRQAVRKLTPNAASGVSRNAEAWEGVTKIVPDPALLLACGYSPLKWDQAENPPPQCGTPLPRQPEK